MAAAVSCSFLGRVGIGAGAVLLPAVYSMLLMTSSMWDVDGFCGGSFLPELVSGLDLIVIRQDKRPVGT